MVFWNDRVLEPPKNRVEGHCKEETARRTTLPDAPGHGELSPVFPANSTCVVPLQ